MKQFFLILILICLIASCDNSKKFEGKWRLDATKLTNNEFDYPASIYIENDSIKFNYYSFDRWHKFPLKMQNKRFQFNNWDIDINKFKDTLFINEVPYVKDDNDSIFNWWWDEPIVNIDLPKVNSTYFKFDEINYNAPNSYAYYGKRLDNDEFCLQLNDKCAETKDLPWFLHIGHNYNGKPRPFPSSILFIDKSAAMKELEAIFFEHKKVNRLKVGLINNINLNYNDSIGLYYDYELLNKRLPFFNESDNYTPNHVDSSPPPPPLPYSPFFDNQKPEPQFILLKNSNFYQNNQIISNTELESLVKEWVKNKNAIFSLYDLESTYGKFLEMTAIINSVYQNERNRLSEIKFSKPLSEVNQDEITAIKLEVPMYHVWSFSIPHYNLVVRENNSFFGLKVPNIDSASSAE